MKEVLFEEMSIKNFLSIGNNPIIFNFPKGVNIITGFNHDKQDENGVGKTSLVESFFWLLFGETLRNLKKDEIVNDVNKKDCIGSLKFTINKNGESKSYRIERGMKPSFCRLFINETEDKTLSSIQLVNEKIQSIISATPSIFRNCVVLCVNESIPFMSQTKTERKEFVESMFRLEAINTMDKIAKNSFNEKLRQQELEIEKNKDLIKNKDIYSSKIADFETQRNNKITNLKSRKDSYSLEVEKLNKSLISVSNSDLSPIELDINKYQLELEGVSKIISDINSTIKSNENLINLHNKTLNDYNKTLEDYKTKLKQFTFKINFPEDLSKQDYLQKIKESTLLEIEKLNKEITVNELNIASSNEKLNKIKVLGASCSECNRPYDKNDIENTNKLIENIKKTIQDSDTTELKSKLKDSNLKIKQFDIMLSYLDINSKKNETSKNIDQLQVATDSKILELQPMQVNSNNIQNTINSLNKKKQEIEKNISFNLNTQNQINSIEKFLKDVDSDITKLIDDSNPFNDILKSTELNINESNSIIAENKRSLNIFETIKFITSDKGIKSYIIKKLLKILNERIAYYLKFFESNAKLEFDEFFDDKLFNDKGLEKSYENFSGGERKRIDLACLFSFLDIRRIQGDVRFNVIFFDELLDSAISSKACSLIFNTLKERLDLYNENSYVITHRAEIKNDSRNIISNYIMLEKRNGFTKIGEIKNGNTI